MDAVSEPTPFRKAKRTTDVKQNVVRRNKQHMIP